MSQKKDLFPFDLAAFEAVSNADSRAKTAPEALTIAAGYLRRREALPPILADYLADAFEVVVAKPEELQAEALALELGLMALNRRRVAVRPWEVAEFVDDPDNGDTEHKRILAAMDHFGLAATTARRYVQIGRNILAEVVKLTREGKAE